MTGSDRAAEFAALLDGLEPGVTELSIQPAIDTPELRALSSEPDERIGDHAVLTDQSTAAAIEAAGVQLISWGALRDLQRSERG